MENLNFYNKLNNVYKGESIMIIQTALGAYKGIKEKDTYVFKGIPFAKAPINERRFKAPEPIEPHH
ncbi:MAG TPA: hypothetical protein DCY20_10500, partial [Firmicutes bacterium]|nr:hypothetical protein [Bacillota bacterium]